MSLCSRWCSGLYCPLFPSRRVQPLFLFPISTVYCKFLEFYPVMSHDCHLVFDALDVKSCFISTKIFQCHNAIALRARLRICDGSSTYPNWESLKKSQLPNIHASSTNRHSCIHASDDVPIHGFASRNSVLSSGIRAFFAWWRRLSTSGQFTRFHHALI